MVDHVIRFIKGGYPGLQRVVKLARSYKSCYKNCYKICYDSCHKVFIRVANSSVNSSSFGERRKTNL